MKDILIHSFMIQSNVKKLSQTKHTHLCSTYYTYSTLCTLYLGSQGPGSRWFPGLAPGSLSLRGPGQDACSPWSESSVPDLHKTVSRGSRGPMVTDRHQLGNALRNNSTCHAHSRYRERTGRRVRFGASSAQRLITAMMVMGK